MTPDDLLKQFNDTVRSVGLKGSEGDLYFWASKDPSYADGFSSSWAMSVRKIIVSAKLYVEARDRGMAAAMLLRLQLS
jgi:hypothetical protein